MSCLTVIFMRSFGPVCQQMSPRHLQSAGLKPDQVPLQLADNVPACIPNNRLVTARGSQGLSHHLLDLAGLGQLKVLADLSPVNHLPEVSNVCGTLWTVPAPHKQQPHEHKASVSTISMKQADVGT